MKAITKQQKRVRRITSIKKKLRGTTERPRIVVFRSNKHISAQVIDDLLGKTLASASDKDVKKVKAKPVEIASEVGKMLGEKAVAAKLKSVVFDRRGYKYHGRVKALADAAREAGLVF